MVSHSLQPHGVQHAGLPVHYQLLELAETRVRGISDAIQPLHPLLSPSLPAFNHSQHQGFFQWVSCSQQAAKVLELQHQSFQRVFRVDFLLRLTGLISLQSKELSRLFCSTAIQKHQFFGAQPSLWSSSHIHTWLLEKPQLWLYNWQSDVFIFNILSRFVIAFL